MTPEGITRHLIAILSADVKDYTRLISHDDVGTIRTLAAYKEAMETLIKRYRGQVVDATGDNLLARFDSILDAVNCAAHGPCVGLGAVADPTLLTPEPDALV